MGKNIPTHKISSRSAIGIFVKHTDDWLSQQPVDSAHRDDYYLFAILLDGEAKVMVDFRDLTLHGGEGIILTPGQVHRPLSGEEIPEVWSLFISSDNISPTLQDKIERYSLATKPLQINSESLKEISSLFGILRRHISDSDVARSTAAAITALFCRSISYDTGATTDRYVSVTLRFKRLVENMYVAEKRPSEYASCLNISRVYLNEAVKATTGMSIGKYIRNHTVVNAKRLLAHTSLNISEIAMSLGYDDPAYFQRLFRKETGTTPSEFRKNIV